MTKRLGLARIKGWEVVIKGRRGYYMMHAPGDDRISLRLSPSPAQEFQPWLGHGTIFCLAFFFLSLFAGNAITGKSLFVSSTSIET